MTPSPNAATPDPVRPLDLANLLHHALDAGAAGVKWADYVAPEPVFMLVACAIEDRRAMQEAMPAQGGGEPTPKQLRDAYAHSDLICPTTHNIEAEILGVWRYLNGQVALPAPEVKDAPVSTSGFGLPSGWKPSPLLGKALDAYRKIKCDYERDDGDRRGIAHALLKAEFGIIEAIFHDHDEDAEVYQNAPVVELMVDLIDRLTNLPRSSLSHTRPAPEVKGAGEACEPGPGWTITPETEAAFKEIEAAQRRGVEMGNMVVGDTTPAPAAASEGLVERLTRMRSYNGFDIPTLKEAVDRIEADAAEMERKDARIAELECKLSDTLAACRRLGGRATAAEAERDALREALEGACVQILDSYRTWVADDIEAHPKPGQIPRYDHARAALRPEAKGGREDVG